MRGIKVCLNLSINLIKVIFLNGLLKYRSENSTEKFCTKYLMDNYASVIELLMINNDQMNIQIDDEKKIIDKVRLFSCLIFLKK